MTIARARQVCLQATPFYHCVSRCVRRAFLCGQDRFTGRSFEHRRAWIEARLAKLAGIFAVDLCAYAVMSNHYHVVVRIDQERAIKWSDDEVIARWLKLYKGPAIVHRYLAGKVENPAELQAVWSLVNTWRERLAELGWFMRNINEPIAREANNEDGCKGRFWEGRYKSQALLDERALLTCMSYVDLNPIRAALATTPEMSRFTSIRARIVGKDTHLIRFSKRFEGSKFRESRAIRFGWHEYHELIEWSGRAMVTNKRGCIPAGIPTVFERLDIVSAGWLAEMKHFGKWSGRAIGSLNKARKYCAATGTSWVKGLQRNGNQFDPKHAW